MGFVKSIFGYVTITGTDNVPVSKFVPGIAVARVVYVAAGYLATWKVKSVGDWIHKINFLNKKKVA